MASATKTAAARGGSAGDNLLKGSDLPSKTTKVKIVCVGVREAPEEFTSPLIMDIEPLYNKNAWALNKTNIKALVQLIGDNYEKWGGYEIEATKFLTQNPQTHKQAWGLSIIGVNKLRRKVKAVPVDDGDVPF